MGSSNLDIKKDRVFLDKGYILRFFYYTFLEIAIFISIIIYNYLNSSGFEGLSSIGFNFFIIYNFQILFSIIFASILALNSKIRKIIAAALTTSTLFYFATLGEGLAAYFIIYTILPITLLIIFLSYLFNHWYLRTQIRWLKVFILFLPLIIIFLGPPLMLAGEQLTCNYYQDEGCISNNIIDSKNPLDECKNAKDMRLRASCGKVLVPTIDDYRLCAGFKDYESNCLVDVFNRMKQNGKLSNVDCESYIEHNYEYPYSRKKCKRILSHIINGTNPYY
jgi:hypothetical protein